MRCSRLFIGVLLTALLFPHAHAPRKGRKVRQTQKRRQFEELSHGTQVQPDTDRISSIVNPLIGKCPPPQQARLVKTGVDDAMHAFCRYRGRRRSK